MFVSILLKGLPREFESFCTLVKYGQDKTLDEIKRDLINFESEKRNDRNTDKSESVFFTNDRTCFNCDKKGHIAKFCRVQQSGPNKEKPNSKITSFKCKKDGHIAKNCFTYKKFESHAMKNERKNNSKESQNLVSEEQEEESFSFFSSENCNERQDFIIDSGATNYMIKDKSTFANLDENFSGIIHNANKTHSAILGKGDVEFFAKNSNEELKKIVLKDALFVPDNSKNLISVSKLREAGVDVSFGEKLKINFNKVSFPFEVENGLFVWKTFPCSNENCFNVDSLQLWHAKMGHNNFSDLKRLPEFVEGMKIGDPKNDCCEICELNKSKKQPVPKDCMTRAKEILDIVHTDVLGKFSPEAVDGHCYAIGFVDSFSRFSKVYFMKTRDEVLDKFKQFCADVGKPGTLVSDGSGEYISNEFKRYCRNQGIRFENMLRILHKKMEKLKEFGELLLLWLAVSWITLAWIKNIGRTL